jgi:quercetin dioxygenase-like cupin family protein
MQTMHLAPAAQVPSPRTVRVLGPGAGEDVWFLDNLLTIKVRGDSGAPFSVIENAMPEGSQTPLHRHEGEDEAFYLLEGTLEIYVDAGWIEAGSGSYVHIPRGTAHGFKAKTAVRMLVLVGTEGFVEMARESGCAAPRHELPPLPPDVSRLEAACERHGITLLGPLPE